MTVRELKDKLGLSVLAGEAGLDKETNGCYITDLLSLAMSHVQEGNIWVTVQTNINIIAVAVLAEASCIVIAEGLLADQNTAQKADSQEIPVLSTTLSSYEFACRLKDLLP